MRIAHGFWSVGLVFLAVLVFEVLQFRARLAVSEALVAAVIPSARTFPSPQLRILIAGDSTAVGVGAADSSLSIAGRVSALYPEADIINAGVSGLRTGGLVAVLDQYKVEQFDLVILQIGGNDIVRFTPLDDVAASIDEVLRRAKKQSKRVVVFTSGNVGTAPIFPYPLRWFMTRRTLAVRQLFTAAVNNHGATYVDLYRERSDDPFVTDPTTYFAADKFHPSDAGYGVWWQRIEPALRQLKF